MFSVSAAPEYSPPSCLGLIDSKALPSFVAGMTEPVNSDAAILKRPRCRELRSC
jgi:hypothetical protein